MSTPSTPAEQLEKEVAVIAAGRPYSTSVTRFRNGTVADFETYEGQVQIACGVTAIGHGYTLTDAIRELMNDVAAKEMRRAA